MAKRGMGWATKLVCSEEDLEDFQDLTQEEHDDKIHSGFIKYFNERTGFGFIACSDTCMYVCMRIYICMYVCVYAYIYACMYVCMRIYIHICMWIYVCVYAYIALVAIFSNNRKSLKHNTTN